MKKVNSQEEFDKIQDFFKYPIYGTDINYTEKNGEIQGFASTFMFPLIQLHAKDMPEVIKNFYSALGRAMGVNSHLVGVVCNNEKLENILKEKEGFRDLGYKILIKEV